MLPGVKAQISQQLWDPRSPLGADKDDPIFKKFIVMCEHRRSQNFMTEGANPRKRGTKRKNFPQKLHFFFNFRMTAGL